MLSAAEPQYWQSWPSRAKTVRRLTATLRSRGTRTYRASLTTEGSGITVHSERKTRSVAWTNSALVSRTSNIARRVDTTPSGSKETFKTSARLVPDDPFEPDDTLQRLAPLPRPKETESDLGTTQRLRQDRAALHQSRYESTSEASGGDEPSPP